ncbi:MULTISPECIES: MarR family winged helix-turn-helix transcriptional regulator [Streptomyces]|uniref:MarR family winged helix-turn-helix transcriptional regulator n=1 Tax=Streptomyces doudnae TaxID=3075536 RepID=A0ABD5F1J3_9ACTN|nr:MULTISPECIES: MarR family winged helix-turn-helix transcriptional regulator [unclassified Streptomyces]MDT0439537.1 MarR family winged helix-turn-helix transcriptional regulator [Streptomyces sp. DSM 41981]MYQ68528.1 MarR family transcriptional regulator [Streptomyces sp. SID4950]SCE46852.1 transcriptional regulator, MarR family [Streptomyces sp. SolWspMP-5a-2]
MTADTSPLPVEPRLGHLLARVHARLARASALALARHGVDGQELAVLAVLACGEPLSQVEAAGRLGVDRTTMVALIDGLEDHGLVVRRRNVQDRRKNIVGLTPYGEECLRHAEGARLAAERRFLAPLGEETAATLLRALQVLVAEDRGRE